MTHEVQGQDWYRNLLKVVEETHRGETDKLGNAQSEHFERVTLRLLRLFPQATRGQVEASMLHDALEPGRPAIDLEAAGVTEEAVRILKLITLPTDGRTYLQYMEDLGDTNDVAAIQVKLADNLDATEIYSSLTTREAQHMVEGVYNPSRRILQDALIRNASQ